MFLILYFGYFNAFMDNEILSTFNLEDEESDDEVVFQLSNDFYLFLMFWINLISKGDTKKTERPYTFEGWSSGRNVNIYWLI